MRNKVCFERYENMQPGLTAEQILHISQEHCRMCGGEQISGQCGWCNKQEFRRIIKFIEQGDSVDNAVISVVCDRKGDMSGLKYCDDRYVLGGEGCGKTKDKDGKKAVER